jgi:repressor LexA
MSGILLGGCDSATRTSGGAWSERVFARRQDSHEQSFGVKGPVEQKCGERVFAAVGRLRYGSEHLYGSGGPGMTDVKLTPRQREVLEVIEQYQRERGFPPSVREIGKAVGLTSPSTVHAHLSALQKLGFLKRDPTKPRAIEVRFDATSGSPAERRPVRHVPLVGDVAAGTDVLAQENIEETLPLPADFTGEGDLFMLRVRGDSMVEAAIVDGDFVVCRAQGTAENGDIVVAGIPGDEATVKTYRRTGRTITLLPSNARLSPMELDPGDVTIYGKVVTVLRRV